jgi:hypothetical protein
VYEGIILLDRNNRRQLNDNVLHIRKNSTNICDNFPYMAIGRLLKVRDRSAIFGEAGAMRTSSPARDAWPWSSISSQLTDLTPLMSRDDDAGCILLCYT